MSVLDRLSVRPVLEREVVATEPDATEWWPLAQSGTDFVALDRQQCLKLLGLSGTGWLSRPGADSSPRRLTSYTITATQFRFVPPLPLVLPVGEVLLFQVAHLEARARTAWSVVLVGPSTEFASEPHRHVNTFPPVALPLASAGIFGSTLATATRPAPKASPSVRAPIESQPS